MPSDASKNRIDTLLVKVGLAETRNRAQAMVMAGVVLANDKRVEKPSEKFALDATIRLKGTSIDLRYVGRGGLKLEAALQHFGIDVAGLDCIDIGASTGGFTDCLLQHGAKRVVCIDSGTNQLDWRLRNDSRVEVRERTNARHLTPNGFDSTFDLAVMDLSFISVKKVIPAVLPLLSADGRLIVLIKPQFEVGKGEVGKGGIVRETEKHDRVVSDINEFAAGLALAVRGVIDSPILGAQGNKEFLALYAK
ncbi:MAG: TlyA family RNA methyltransferase [Pyrinomonadaceae bacterium]|nr:TlyA family RNA methyltransferase [Pyrinomonadaceae bacterium]